ncbi:MAG: hypothetical protein ACI9XC_001333 [Gammaproteobacteria bacterium]
MVPDPIAGKQFREFNPFWEIDDRVGYYIGGTWSYMQRMKIKYVHYDNRADPTARKGSQLAWKNRFDHISAEIELPYGIRLIGQYINGFTFIYDMDQNSKSDSDYDAWFIMLSRRINKHRLSARFENFRVDDLDSDKRTVHNANEDGRSWMLAYRYQLNKEVQLGLEWIQIQSNNASRFLTGGVASEKESQLLFNLNYSF